MAVYTQITEQEFLSLLEQYDIGVLRDLRGISEGVQNSNYLLETDKGKYIATIYESSVDTDDLPFFLGLMEHLAGAGIPCPLPVHALDGRVILEVKDKPFAITCFLEGRSPKSISNEHCAETGKILARMHIATQDFTMNRSNNMSIAGFSAIFDRIKEADVESGISFGEIERSLQYITENWPDGLPCGVIHADLFPDNVFFEGGVGDVRVSGLLDFYFSCNDLFAYDLAIVLNAWCFEHGTEFNITKARHLLSGYNSQRPFTEDELDALPVLACGAAMRFLLTRLYDSSRQVDGAIVTQKDPMEYLQKLRFHRQVKHCGEYGL